MGHVTVPPADRPAAQRATARIGPRAGIVVALLLVALGGVVQTVRYPDAVPEGPLQRTDAPGATRIIDLADRYEPFVTLRALAPGATIVWDAADDPLLYAPYLYAIAGIGDVRTSVLPDDVEPATAPTASGSPISGEPWWRGSWTLHLDEGAGPPSTILVRRVPGGVALVDARLVEGGFDVGAGVRPLWPDDMTAAAAAAIGTPAPTLARAAAVETAVLVLLLLVGGLLLPRAGPNLPAAARVPLAFLVGVALQAMVGLLRVPGVWSLAVTIGVATVVAVRAEWRTGWTMADWVPLTVGMVVIAVTTTWARTYGFLRTTPDSFDYLAGARLLADGHLPTSILELKRGIGQQSLHAPATTLGVEGLQALGAVLLLAGLALLVLLSEQRRSRPLVVLAVVALLASPAVPRMAAVINSHVLVAVLLLALVMAVGRDVPPVVIGLLGAGLVLLRPEGPFLAALVLLGTLRGGGPVLAGAWRVLGVTTIAWYGLLLAGAATRPSGVPTVIPMMLVVGALLTVSPDVLRRLPDGSRRRLPLAVAVVLWTLAVGVLLVGEVGDADELRFLSATVTNLGEGVGEWGLIAPTMLVLAAWAVLTGERRDDDPGVLGARWALIGFVPVSLLAKLGDGFERSGSGLATLLSGGARQGWADSINRAWMHALLLVVFLVVVRAAAGRASERVAERAAGDGPRRVAVRAVALGVVAVTVATLWAPRFVVAESALVDHEQRTVAALRFGGAEPLVDLLDGRIVEQRLILPAPTDPDGVAADAPLVRACAAPVFVTFGRENVGTLRVTLAAGGATSTHVVEASDLTDFGAERFCLPIPGALPDELAVTVAGIGAPPGATVGLVAGTGGDADDPLVRVAEARGAGLAQAALAAPVALTVTVEEVVRSVPPPLAPTTPRSAAGILLLAVPILLALLVVLDLVPRRRRAVASVAVGLATLLLGAVLVPHGRTVVPAFPLDVPGIPAEPAGTVALTDGGLVERVLSPRLAPAAGTLRSDPWGGFERRCLTVEVVAVPDEWTSGGLHLATAPAVGEPFIPAADVRPGRLTTCAAIDGPDVGVSRVTFRTEGIDPAAGVAGELLLRAGAALADEPPGPAPVLGIGREAVGPHEPVLAVGGLLAIVGGVVAATAGRTSRGRRRSRGDAD